MCPSVCLSVLITCSRELQIEQFFSRTHPIDSQVLYHFTRLANFDWSMPLALAVSVFAVSIINLPCLPIHEVSRPISDRSISSPRPRRLPRKQSIYYEEFAPRRWRCWVQSVACHVRDETRTMFMRYINNCVPDQVTTNKCDDGSGNVFICTIFSLKYEPPHVKFLNCGRARTLLYPSG